MIIQFVGAKNREGDVREFVFKPADGFVWRAGQYMHYVLPHDNADERGIERWFTNSAAPSEGEIRITTRINHEHSSSFKRVLLSLQPGDEIETDGPEGDFVLADPTRNYIYIAGGIGITPVRSILTEAAAQGLQPNVTLLYANRYKNIVFQDEFFMLQESNPNLKIRYVVEPERLDDTLLKQTLEKVEDPLVCVAGPKPMVEDMLEQLKALGVKEENLKYDDFPGYEKI